MSHSYVRHVHDAYVLAVIEQGAQTFEYRRESCVAAAGDVVILEPGEAHDGRPYGDRGYLYRTLHIEPELLADSAGRLPAFRRVVLQDGGLQARVRRLCCLLDRGDDSETEICRDTLDEVIAALRERHADHCWPAARESWSAERFLASSARRMMIASDGDERPTIDQIASRLDVSRSHLSRAFSRAYGLPPGSWLRQRRLAHALSMIRAGRPSAQVALEAGFADQSHFIRRFKAVYGFTPGQAEGHTRGRASCRFSRP